VLFPAPSPTVLPAYPLPAPRSHTNAAAVAASIQAVVGQLRDGRADALRESFLPALRPALSAEILASCRARLLSASLTPDWEMAEESSLAGHPVVRVSLFAKGMTGFHLVGGHWLADAVWCAPPRP
jgi:hypothetical protein